MKFLLAAGDKMYKQSDNQNVKICKFTLFLLYEMKGLVWSKYKSMEEDYNSHSTYCRWH